MCQLDKGRIFHSALKSSKAVGNTMSVGAIAFLKLLVNPTVVLVVADEISILKSGYLVLLDERL